MSDMDFFELLVAALMLPMGKPAFIAMVFIAGAWIPAAWRTRRFFPNAFCWIFTFYATAVAAFGLAAVGGFKIGDVGSVFALGHALFFLIVMARVTAWCYPRQALLKAIPSPVVSPTADAARPAIAPNPAPVASALPSPPRPVTMSPVPPGAAAVATSGAIV